MPYSVPDQEADAPRLPGQVVEVDAAGLERLIDLTGVLAAAGTACLVLAGQHSSAAVQGAARNVNHLIEQVRAAAVRLLGAHSVTGFLVGAGEHRYLIPLASVRECRALPSGAPAGTRFRIVSNGQLLPCLRLGMLFGSGAAGPREDVVLIEAGGHWAGLVVDRLLGHRQVQSRPLARQFSQVPGVAGSALLDDGSVAMILDAAVLACADWPEAARCEAGAGRGHHEL